MALPGWEYDSGDNKWLNSRFVLRPAWFADGFGMCQEERNEG